MARRASPSEMSSRVPGPFIAALAAVLQHVSEEQSGEGGQDEELAAALAAAICRLRSNRRVGES